MLGRRGLLLLIAVIIMGLLLGTGGVFAHEFGEVKGQKVEWEKFKEQGYSMEDLLIAKGIAYKANRELEEVLAYYKANDSWEKTAEEFGVDWQKIKAKGEKVKAKHNKMKKFFAENEGAILTVLGDYLDVSAGELKQLKEESDKDFCFHQFMYAAVISKISGRPITEIWQSKQGGTPLREVAKNLNVEKEETWREMEKLKKAIYLIKER